MIGILGVNAGWAFPWPPLAGLAVALLAALFFGSIALRTFDIPFLMITLAIGQLCWALSNQWMSVFRGYDGIQGIRPPVIAGLDLSDPQVFYYTLFIVFVAIVLGLRKVVDSHFGLALRGIKESPDRMAALGYSVFGLRLAAFVLAGMVAAVGGIFSVYFTGIITPGVLDLERTIWVLLIVILGGASYFWGPLFGTILVIVLDVIISPMTDRYNSIIGLIFLFIVLFSVDKGLGKLPDYLPRSLRVWKANE
jgi:branched-chain amino acid transport system permease protein